MHPTAETPTTFNFSDWHQFTNSGISDIELDPVRASSSLFNSSVDAVSTWEISVFIFSAGFSPALSSMSLVA